METVRLHVQDSFLALVVTYLKLGSRNIATDFNPAWSAADRQCVVDGVTFQIAHKLPGQPHEKPGVNVVFYDELSGQGPKPQQGFTRLVTVHVYIPATTNPAADDRTLSLTSMSSLRWLCPPS
jgi:hypothetical protein